MSTQLDPFLAYLDREGVTELVFSSGRPIAMRKHGNYSNLTQKPLSRDQLVKLLHGTAIAIPTTDGMAMTSDVDVGSRRVRVQVGKRGDDLVVRIERATSAQTAEPARPAPTPEAPAKAAPAARPAPEPPAKAPPPRAATAPIAPAPILPPAVAMPPAAAARSKRSSAEELSLDELVPVARTFPELVKAARDRGASDLHIATGRVVSIRVAGELVPLDRAAPPLGVPETEALLLSLLGPPQHAQLAATGYTDLAVEAVGGRLRANIARHQLGLKGTFRLARTEPATLDELGLPKDLAKVVAHHQGLVVIAGPSGHGKTTTLASLVDLINTSKPAHILTIEDPIEIVHPRKTAVVSQREIGAHTKSFGSGLKASLREDPDVIVIGELRDRETVEIALTAAETGHLVLSTMSTPSAAKTIDRLIDMFPAEEHTQVRASIAGALRAIVAQRLLPAAGGGVVAAVELLTGVLPLAALIRDDKLYQLPNLMQRGRAFGMIRLDDSLLELLRAGRITEDAALAASDNKKELATVLRPVVVPPTQAAPRGRIAGALFGKKDQD